MIKIFIIEDEDYIRKGLIIQLNELDLDIKIVGESSTVNRALKQVAKVKPNIILLDINLLDGSGFDFLEQTKFNQFNVIFITSYEEHAIRALKLGAIDYILKPIDIDELNNAIIRANNQKIKKTIKTDIIIKYLNGSETINLNQLIYCVSDKGYTTFFMKNKSSIMSSKPLKEYEEILLKNGFIRTHQSYFVNCFFIERFDIKKRILFLKEEFTVPVSARKVSILNKIFNN